MTLLNKPLNLRAGKFKKIQNLYVGLMRQCKKLKRLIKQKAGELDHNLVLWCWSDAQPKHVTNSVESLTIVLSRSFFRTLNIYENLQGYPKKKKENGQTLEEPLHQETLIPSKTLKTMLQNTNYMGTFHNIAHSTNSFYIPSQCQVTGEVLGHQRPVRGEEGADRLKHK